MKAHRFYAMLVGMALFAASCLGSTLDLERNTSYVDSGNVNSHTDIPSSRNASSDDSSSNATRHSDAIISSSVTGSMISSIASSSQVDGSSSSSSTTQSSHKWPGTEVSTTVMIYSFSDMEAAAGSKWSPCQVAVNNSKGFNAQRISYVITVFAVWSSTPAYYYKEREGYWIPTSVTTDSIARYKAGLARCFRAGLDAGFTTLHIIAHVDFVDSQIGGHGLWRNIVRFNPTAKYGAVNTTTTTTGFSYNDVLLQPAAEALNDVINYDTAVEFTVAGEQGLSTWSFPRAYTELMKATKAITSRGKDPAKHRYGVSFNYDKVCGCVEPEEKDPILYNNTYLARFERVRPQLAKIVDVEGVKELLDKSDFIGLSSYAPLPAHLTPAAMEVSIQTLAFEMQAFGIDLKTYIFGKDKPLIYSEQGLGGGGEGNRVAPDLRFVREHPFWGTSTVYSYKEDPWRVPQYREYRRQLYRQLTQWAAAGGGPQYRIDGIYVWSSGSWDVHGVHPRSTSKSGTYADKSIKGYIKESNAVVNRKAAQQLAK